MMIHLISLNVTGPRGYEIVTQSNKKFESRSNCSNCTNVIQCSFRQIHQLFIPSYCSIKSIKWKRILANGIITFNGFWFAGSFFHQFKLPSGLSIRPSQFFIWHANLYQYNHPNKIMHQFNMFSSVKLW